MRRNFQGQDRKKQGKARFGYVQWRPPSLSPLFSRYSHPRRLYRFICTGAHRQACSPVHWKYETASRKG